MGLCCTGLMGQSITCLHSKAYSVNQPQNLSVSACKLYPMSIMFHCSFLELDCRGLMGLSEQMLRMSGIGGLQLGPIRWQGKANGKSVPPVDTPLPLQQVGILNSNNRDDTDNNSNSINNNKIYNDNINNVNKY